MYTYPEPCERLLDPSPRLVSRQLLTRHQLSARDYALNVLAAAWIQFEVHDWFSPWHLRHASLGYSTRTHDDPWPDPPMLIKRTAPDPSPDPEGPPTYVTQDHALVGQFSNLWWCIKFEVC